MRSSDQPRQAGYIVSLALIFIISFGILMAVFWYQNRLLETELLQRQLLVRLKRELPPEVRRLYAQARASGSVPDMRLIEAQAFINLHNRGRRQMVALENQRQRVKHLVANRVDARRQLSQLGLEVRRAKMWVLMLEQKLKTLPQVRREPSRTFRLPLGDTSVPSWLVASGPPQGRRAQVPRTTTAVAFTTAVA